MRQHGAKPKTRPQVAPPAPLLTRTSCPRISSQHPEVLYFRSRTILGIATSQRVAPTGAVVV